MKKIIVFSCIMGVILISSQIAANDSPDYKNCLMPIRQDVQTSALHSLHNKQHHGPSTCAKITCAVSIGLSMVGLAMYVGLH